MIRTSAVLPVALLLVGCTRFQSASQGPGKPDKDLPPPYGSRPPASAPPHPVGGQSPLDIPSAGPAPPVASDNLTLIPPKGRVQAPPADPRPAAAAPVDPAAKNLADLKALVAAASAAWKAIDTYEMTQTRRELNPKGLINDETVFIQYRREPLAVYTLNTGDNGKGRELIYNPSQFEDKIHVRLGKGDPFPGEGRVPPAVSPDYPMVKAKARYSIREAGLGRMTGALGAAVARLEAGTAPPDALTYRGEVRRDEFPHPVVGVTHKLRPGDDPVMPTGGTRLYFFDLRKGSPAYGLPVLVVATDEKGQEVEYYLSEKVKQPANLTDAAFDPARLKKK
jgi:hypothetical protein